MGVSGLYLPGTSSTKWKTSVFTGWESKFTALFTRDLAFFDASIRILPGKNSGFDDVPSHEAPMFGDVPSYDLHFWVISPLDFLKTSAQHAGSVSVWDPQRCLTAKLVKTWRCRAVFFWTGEHQRDTHAKRCGKPMVFVGKMNYKWWISKSMLTMSAGSLSQVTLRQSNSWEMPELNGSYEWETHRTKSRFFPANHACLIAEGQPSRVVIQ